VTAGIRESPTAKRVNDLSDLNTYPIAISSRSRFVQRNTSHVIATALWSIWVNSFVVQVAFHYDLISEDESAVENKELSRLLLRRIKLRLLFPVETCRCVYRTWEEFIPRNLAGQKREWKTEECRRTSEARPGGELGA
jgi:hypothetical protein